MATRPLVGRSSVARMRSRVVFPAPFGPSRPNMPCPRCRSMPRNASCAPYRFVTRSITTSIDCKMLLPLDLALGHAAQQALLATQEPAGPDPEYQRDPQQ